MPKTPLKNFHDPKTPDEIILILVALANANCIIIGGQAINIWSIKLEKVNQEPWKSGRPYTSTDADGFGDRPSIVKLAKALQDENYTVEVQMAVKPEELRVNTGIITATSKKLNISINILSQPLGLSPQEVLQTAQPIPFRDKTLKLLHPLLCVEGKATCLIQLPQNDPKNPRQDEKHLVLSLANLCVYLEMLGDDNPEDAVKIANRIPGLALHELGIEILRRHNIDVLEGVPWKHWQTSQNPLLREFGGQLEKILSERKTAIERDFQARKWLKELKDKPAGRKETIAEAGATSNRLPKSDKDKTR